MQTKQERRAASAQMARCACGNTARSGSDKCGAYAEPREPNRLELLERAVELIDTFAWSCVTADCNASRAELNRRIECVRSAMRGEDFTV
jgi:hypothetical protein